jgi:hypothetical protein
MAVAYVGSDPPGSVHHSPGRHSTGPARLHRTDEVVVGASSRLHNDSRACEVRDPTRLLRLHRQCMSDRRPGHRSLTGTASVVSGQDVAVAGSFCATCACRPGARLANAEPESLGRARPWSGSDDFARRDPRRKVAHASASSSEFDFDKAGNMSRAAEWRGAAGWQDGLHTCTVWVKCPCRYREHSKECES